jgi:hypothetical protein
MLGVGPIGQTAEVLHGYGAWRRRAVIYVERVAGVG